MNPFQLWEAAGISYTLAIRHGSLASRTKVFHKGTEPPDGEKQKLRRIAALSCGIRIGKRRRSADAGS